MIKMLIILSFNTVNGRYYYNITFVFPSFQSGTRDVRASSSLCSSAASHPSSHTASGKYCCNKLKNSKLFLVLWITVSIPQAVSTVATGVFLCALLVNRVSIPQAVSTVATYTLSGETGKFKRVSIPQAVSTVATRLNKVILTKKYREVSIPQAVSTVATWMNKQTLTLWNYLFQYRKR